MAIDTPEIRQLLDDVAFGKQLGELAAHQGRGDEEVRAEAAGYLREMSARHEPAIGEAWQRLSRWALHAYDVTIDPDQTRRLRKLDRRHSLVVLFSHRSYLDGLVLPRVLNGQGISPAFILGGANLNFFPFGAIASRSGIVFIRRDTKDQPLYRFTLRSYIGQLIRNRQNLSWSIEGGRTRTGKLRPPLYGILRYVVDAAEAVAGPEVLLLPVSIVYDQLHEVAGMTAEARGGRKTPEDLRWLVRYTLQQRIRLGRAYLDFGEPVPLRERLAELRGETGDSDDTSSAAQDAGRDDGHQVERLALDVCHRINQVTPITATAAVTLAMLAADRALSLEEVLRTVAPLARYLAARRWPVAGGANLTDRSTVRRTLQELTGSGVLSSYDGGDETVWGMRPGQHLVAAFYRNTAIHALVDRAIGEVSVLAATEADEGEFWSAAWKASLRLRDLLKFEFFFATRSQYAHAMREELSFIDPQRVWIGAEVSADEARQWLRRAQPLLAHLVLRPFLDAYLVVADQLACYGDDEFDEPTFLEDCLGVARQRALQRRITSEESVSLELFKTALRLARHRGLLDSDDPHLDKRREDFATELADAVRRVNAIGRMAWAQTAAEIRER